MSHGSECANRRRRRSTFTPSAKIKGNGEKCGGGGGSKVTAETGVVPGPPAELGQCAASVCDSLVRRWQRLSFGQEMRNDSPAEQTGSRKRTV